MSIQNGQEKIRTCCRYTPEIFRDTKVGCTEEMWVAACPSCGKFSDHLERGKAIWKWNEGFAEKNPKDLEFIKKLENAKRGLE